MRRSEERRGVGRPVYRMSVPPLKTFVLKMASSAVFFCLSLALAAASGQDGWSAVSSAWRECRSSEDAGDCLGRQVASLGKKDIDLGGGLLLKRSQEEERTGKAFEDQGHGLYSKLAGFFSGRSLVLDLPTFSGRQLEQGIEEGRGKMKKMMGNMMMMGAMKAMMVIPMMLGTLFLLAGKAFVIAKIALVLALIVTLKKLVASKQESSGHGWSGGGGGGWDRRSLDSHVLAYSAHSPQ